MTLRTPQEGGSGIDEKAVRSEFVPMVLAVKRLEEEKERVISQLEKAAFLERPRLTAQIRVIDEQLEREKTEMVRYVTRYFYEENIPHLLKIVSVIFREVYKAEEGSSSPVSSREPLSLRPVGITKSLEFHEAVRSAMAENISDDKSRTAVIKDRTEKVRILFEQELGLPPLNDHHIYKNCVDEFIFIEGMRFSDRVQTINTDAMHAMNAALDRALGTEGLDPEVIIRIAQVVHPSYAFLMRNIVNTRLRIKGELK